MSKYSIFLLLLTGLFFNTFVFAQPELDTSFGGSGKVIFGGYQGSVNDVVVQPDNKILFAGGCSFPGLATYPLCLYRRNEDGSNDATYAAPLNEIPGSTAFANKSFEGIALQKDGKIVAVGFSTFSANKVNVIIIRYNSDGSPDTSFGTNGYVIKEFSGNSYGKKVVIQPDQKILIVGFAYETTSTSSPYRQFVARFKADGTFDGTFGNGGIVTINLPDVSSGLSIVLQADGKIVTGGNTRSNNVSYGLMTRLNRDGSLDTTFDEDGFKIVSGTNVGSFISTAVQTDGRILALTNTNTLYRFASDGAFDTSFDGDGMRQALNGNSSSHGVNVTPGGKITVVGNQPTTLPLGLLDFRIARYLPNGSPDTSFSGDGFLDVDFVGKDDGARAVTFDRQGRIVIGGLSGEAHINQPFLNPRFAAIRLKAAPVQNVKFTGRATLQNGTPARNAIITLKKGSEIIGTSFTNPFGYFRFANVQTNETYTLSVKAKNAGFYDQNVLVDGEITEYNVVGEKVYSQ